MTRHTDPGKGHGFFLNNRRRARLAAAVLAFLPEKNREFLEHSAELQHFSGYFH
jgi:hypothetical protein